MKSFLLLLVIFTGSFMVYSQPKNNQLPMYKNPKAPKEQRVKDLLGRMTVEEKAGQLNQLNGGAFTGQAMNKFDGISKINYLQLNFTRTKRKIGDACKYL